MVTLNISFSIIETDCYFFSPRFIAFFSLAKLICFFIFLPSELFKTVSYLLSIFSRSNKLLWMLDMPKVCILSNEALIDFTDLLLA